MNAPVKTENKIRPGERRTLAAMVRRKFKLLRTQIEQRHAQQMAEVSGRVAKKFQDDDIQMQALREQLTAVTERANEEAKQLFDAYTDYVSPRRDVFTTPWVNRRQDGKEELRRALVTAIEAQTLKARQALSQQEDDMLTSLELGSLTSEDAQAFVTQLPTPESLMPAERLAEIEARWS